MCTAYYNVLERLKEERCRLHLSQSEMGQLVPMSQSNYSKIELGQRRLSYYEMQYLCRTDVDIHYIFTGQRYNGKQEELLENSTYAELISYLRILYSLAVPRKQQQPKAQWDVVFDKVQYVPLIVENYSSGSLFSLLRRSMNYQQQKMAKTMGIDVKKLRDLENGRSLPDSELLYRMYDLFHVSPSIVLKDRDSLICEISILLDTINTESRKEIIKFLTTLRKVNE